MLRLPKRFLAQKIGRKVKRHIYKTLPFSLYSPSCAIFLFHTVEATKQPWTDGHRYVTSSKNFRTQIQFINKNFEILSSTEFIETLKAGNLNKNIAAIHFDDGFSSYADCVVPFLREKRIPSTIFLINSALDGKVPIRNKLAFCLNSAGREALLQKWQKIIERNDLDDIHLAIMNNSRILSWAKQFITLEMEQIIETIYKKYSKTYPHEIPFLNRESVLKLKQEPYVEFGSHTVNHLMLSHLDTQQQQFEILEGHRKLEQLIGRTLMHFAYPHGGQKHFNEISKQVVLDSDSIVAYSGYGGINQQFDRADVKRISLANQSPMELKSLLLSFQDDL